MTQLTSVDLDRLAAELPLVKAWVTAVETMIEARLNAGEVFGNAQLVPKNAIRKWSDGFDVTTLLTQFSPLDVVAPRIPLSPSQAEKVLGRTIYRNEIAEHVVKESSGLRLAYTSTTQTEREN